MAEQSYLDYPYDQQGASQEQQFAENKGARPHTRMRLAL